MVSPVEEPTFSVPKLSEDEEKERLLIGPNSITAVSEGELTPCLPLLKRQKLYHKSSSRTRAQACSSSLYACAQPPLSFGKLDNPTEAPGLEEMHKRPDDLQPVPASPDHWPPDPIKVACPACGLYMTTMIEPETGARTVRRMHSD